MDGVVGDTMGGGTDVSVDGERKRCMCYCFFALSWLGVVRVRYHQGGVYMRIRTRLEGCYSVNCRQCTCYLSAATALVMNLCGLRFRGSILFLLVCVISRCGRLGVSVLLSLFPSLVFLRSWCEAWLLSGVVPRVLASWEVEGIGGSGKTERGRTKGVVATAVAGVTTDFLPWISNLVFLGDLGRGMCLVDLMLG